MHARAWRQQLSETRRGDILARRLPRFGGGLAWLRIELCPARQYGRAQHERAMRVRTRPLVSLLPFLGNAGSGWRATKHAGSLPISQSSRSDQLGSCDDEEIPLGVMLR
jgi:hypothetical protein